MEVRPGPSQKKARGFQKEGTCSPSQAFPLFRTSCMRSSCYTMARRGRPTCSYLLFQLVLERRAAHIAAPFPGRHDKKTLTDSNVMFRIWGRYLVSRSTIDCVQQVPKLSNTKDKAAAVSGHTCTRDIDGWRNMKRVGAVHVSLGYRHVEAEKALL